MCLTAPLGSDIQVVGKHTDIDGIDFSLPKINDTLSKYPDTESFITDREHLCFDLSGLTIKKGEEVSFENFGSNHDLEFYYRIIDIQTVLAEEPMRFQKVILNETKIFKSFVNFIEVTHKDSWKISYDPVFESGIDLEGSQTS